MNNEIYSFWIKGDLNQNNRLTIKSFLDHGHEFIIYSYVHIPDAGCEVRDAREIIPENEVFFLDKMDQRFMFGGIAERMKAELLFRFGGWHVDMDVTCLSPLFAVGQPYVLRRQPNPDIYIANIIKAPKGCGLSCYYKDKCKLVDSNNTDFLKGVKSLTEYINQNPALIQFTDTNRWFCDAPNSFVSNDGEIPPTTTKAIHWQNTHNANNYEPGSYYESLLIKHNII